MNPNVQVFASIVTAVFLEASPFLFLGAFVSAIFEVCVPQDKLDRILPRGKVAGLLFGLFAGMLIPTCECGVVSIVRRLIKKGVPAHAAITYMFSAPIINPLVMAATYVAYRGDVRMVAGRVCLAALCAGCLGMVFTRINPASLLREDEDSPGALREHLHERLHEHAECGPFCAGAVPSDAVRAAATGAVHAHTAPPGAAYPMAGECACHAGLHEGSKIMRIFGHIATEFLDMGKYLVLGAVAVGVFRLFPPRDLLILFEQNLFLAVGAMMLLAILVSVCSEADAFVAASFSMFPSAAQLAFMVLGPMVDLKLLFMYSAVFRKRIVPILVLTPIAIIYVLSTILGLTVGATP